MDYSIRLLPNQYSCGMEILPPFSLAAWPEPDRNVEVHVSKASLENSNSAEPRLHCLLSVMTKVKVNHGPS